MTYAKRFEAGLARPGKTRAGVAHAMGISQQAVYAIVKGKTKSATAENNAAAAAYFGCDPTWLATGRGLPGWTGDKPPPPPRDFSDPRKVSDSEWQILEDLRAVHDEDRKALAEELHAKAERYREVARLIIGKVNGNSKVKP